MPFDPKQYIHDWTELPMPHEDLKEKDDFNEDQWEEDYYENKGEL